MCSRPDVQSARWTARNDVEELAVARYLVDDRAIQRGWARVEGLQRGERDDVEPIDNESTQSCAQLRHEGVYLWQFRDRPIVLAAGDICSAPLPGQLEALAGGDDEAVLDQAGQCAPALGGIRPELFDLIPGDRDVRGPQFRDDQPAHLAV